MPCLALLSLILGLFITTPASAQDGETGYKAMVEVTAHQISVNRGEGFRQVDGITPVNPGDLVMASATPEGSGWIIYPDCDVEVLPGRVYTVEDRPGVVQIRDAKEHRPICKKPVAWWLLAVPPIIACAAFCFDNDEQGGSP
jgi:hypothetical protein